MRLLPYLILMTALLIGCSTPKERYKLKGDWVAVGSNDLLIITDSTIKFFWWIDFQQYWVHNDTIFFEAIDELTRDYSYLDSAEWKPRIKRKVIHGTDTLGKFIVKKDTLVLNNFDWNSSIMQYYRLQKLSDLTFDSLFFETSTCYGICPSMKLKLLSNGDFFFKGEAYTEKSGSYVGKLSPSLVDLIHDKIDLLDFDRYALNYDAGHTDGQTRRFILYHNGIREYVYVYGHDDEPAEINVVFHYLQALYKWTDLQQSEEELRFEEFEKNTSE